MPKTIRSRVLTDEYLAHELGRRQFIAAAGAALVAGCSSQQVSNSEGAEEEAFLVGIGGGSSHKAAVENALSLTIGRDGLSFIQSGDVVYLKVNTNSGDPYPYSTNPKLVEMVAGWARDHGASKVIVGDRSFFGDPNTMGNFESNGIAAAAANAGAELVVFDDDAVEWLEISQDDAPDWVGGFRFPVPVVQANVIINLPCVKTHFISTFTMGMKNIIGLVNPVDRAREGNLKWHVTEGNKLYKQIAQLNRHITPTFTILDGYRAVVRGGPNIDGDPPGLTRYARCVIASPDRIAADATGVALLKLHAVEGEAVHDTSVWENPQIAEAIAAGVGIAGAEEYHASAKEYSRMDELSSQLFG